MSKPPDLTIVWAVHDGIAEAGQMTRAHCEASPGWKEVDANHAKVKVALTAAVTQQQPDTGATPKEK